MTEPSTPADTNTPAQPEAPNTQAPHTQTPDPQAPGSQPNDEAENRGSPPGYGNGEVTGAGAGAGGSGAAEDYDDDPAGGGGSFPPAEPKEGEGGADEPHGGTR